MKIDVGLVCSMVQAMKEDDVVETEEVGQHFINMLKKLEPIFEGGEKRKLLLSDDDDDEFYDEDHLVVKNGRHVPYFMKFWMCTNEGTMITEAKGNRGLFVETEEPVVLFIRKKKGEFIEACIKTLMQSCLRKQESVDVWTAVEGLYVLFEYWMQTAGERVVGGSAMFFCTGCQHELVSFCQIMVNRLNAVLTRKGQKRCRQMNEVTYEAMLMKGVLQMFELLGEFCTEFPEGSSVNEIIQVTSSCLVHPIFSNFRELFWKAAVLLPKITALSPPAAAQDLLLKLQTKLFEKIEEWIYSPWKTEAVFGMLSSIIPLVRELNVKADTAPDIHSLILNILLKGMSFKLVAPARTNAIFAMGLVFEHFGDNISEGVALECIDILKKIFFSDESGKSRILRENLLGAFARIYSCVLDPISVKTVVPYLHKELPLVIDVEENVAIFKFWNCWFDASEVISPNMDGLVDATVATAMMYQMHDGIRSEMSTVFENMARIYPERIPGFLQRLHG